MAQCSRKVLALAAVLIAGASVVGCSSDEPAPPAAATPTGAKLNGDFSGSGIGTLVDAYTLPGVDIELRDSSSLAARISYMSVLGTNNNILETTAAVFVPRGQPPSGGWPTVALGHPTTGTLPECAPSTSRDLRGLSSTVVGFLRAGFVVTVPDYQGLGSDEADHPYLDSTTVGFNLIDSVRAARKLVRQMSARWAAVGVDQGGQAAWAANELVSNFGGGLEFLGAISVSPFSQLDGMASDASAGVLNWEQKLMLVNYLSAMKKQYDEDFDLGEFRRGSAEQNWDLLLSCDGPNADAKKKAAQGISNDDVRPAGPAAVETLRGFLRKTSLPQGLTGAPMWVIYGDRDPLIPRSWTEAALERACEYGDVVQTSVRPGYPQYIDVPASADWIRARLRNEPPVNDCESETATEPGVTEQSATTDVGTPTTSAPTPGGVTP